MKARRTVLSVAMHGRRRSAAPASASSIRAGEVYQRVFQGDQIGMAINSDHTIGRVHKEGAADYAGVQVGDVILELNNRRVDASAAVHHISRSIKLSQIFICYDL